MHGARREAVEVYLEASGVGARLDAGEAVRVLEIGFGLALNYLVTADRALESRARSARLDYHAVEHELQSAATLAALAHERHLVHRTPLVTLLAALETTPSGPSEAGRIGLDRTPERHIAGGAISLSLHLVDASASGFADDAFDAIYLDAFSPTVNPECWTPAFLGALHGALRPGGALVSYCVRGEVRRTLESAGFLVTRLPGPPGKRQTLLAARP